jgi:hypothetical protein
MSMIRDIIDDLRQNIDIAAVQEKYWELAKKKNTVYRDLLGTTTILEMFVELWDYRAYFSRTKFFSPFSCRPLIKRHGAVSDLLFINYPLVAQSDPFSSWHT